MYMDLAWEQKKEWNMKVMLEPNVISALGTIPKGFVRERKELKIRGRDEGVKTTVMFSSVRILRRILGPGRH